MGKYDFTNGEGWNRLARVAWRIVFRWGMVYAIVLFGVWWTSGVTWNYFYEVRLERLAGEGGFGRLFLYLGFFALGDLVFSILKAFKKDPWGKTEID